MDEICRSRGQTDLKTQDWLVLRPENRKLPDIEAFPRPEKRSDGSYIYEKVPNVPGADVDSTSIGVNRQQMFYKKRAYEERSSANEGLPAPKVRKTWGWGYFVSFKSFSEFIGAKMSRRLNMQR